MSMFLLSKKTFKEIVSSISKFWWSHMNKVSKIYWRKWTLLVDTKSKGGFDFRDLEAFNKELLAKQLWRIIENPDFLASQILKSKYFTHSSVLDSKLGHIPYLIWRSIRSSLDLLKECMI